MPVLLDLVLATEGELPAHLGLVLEWVDAAVEGGQVKSAAGAGGEVGAVEKDAGITFDAGHQLAVLVGVDHRLLGAVVLPLFAPSASWRSSRPGVHPSCR